MTIKKGDICRCEQSKQIGIVTSKFKSSSRADTEYFGLCLDPKRVGLPWQTTKPERLGTIKELVHLLEGGQ